MKIINFIFSIYLIVLSCLPCADLEVGSPSHSLHEISTTNDKHSHDANDACSPFCACSCCGGQVFVYQTHYNFSSFRKIIDAKVSEYPPLFASSYFGSIWQPPQINS